MGRTVNEAAMRKTLVVYAAYDGGLEGCLDGLAASGEDLFVVANRKHGPALARLGVKSALANGMINRRTLALPLALLRHKPEVVYVVHGERYFHDNILDALGFWMPLLGVKAGVSLHDLAAGKKLTCSNPSRIRSARPLAAAALVLVAGGAFATAHAQGGLAGSA